MIVANLLQNTIGQDENEVTIYDDAGAHTLPRAAKSRLAQAIVAHAVDLMESRLSQRRARLEPIS